MAGRPRGIPTHGIMLRIPVPLYETLKTKAKGNSVQSLILRILRSNNGTIKQQKPRTLRSKRKEAHAHLDSIILDGFAKLGGVFEGRSMDLRKHLKEALKESQIKDTILRLVKNGVMTISGENNSRKRYEVVK